MKIFLSFAFNHGQALTRAVERLLASHDIEIITGRRLGGETVDEAVKARILQADGYLPLFSSGRGGSTVDPIEETPAHDNCC